MFRRLEGTTEQQLRKGLRNMLRSCKDNQDVWRLIEEVRGPIKYKLRHLLYEVQNSRKG